MSNFTISSGPASRQDAQHHADQLETHIGEILNGRRKAGNLSVESIAVLIQFARTRSAIFRLASPEGRVRIYNTSNHASVKDETTARAAYLDETGYEATSVNAYTFDELDGATELADFALYGLG